MESMIAGHDICGREIGRLPTTVGERHNFNRATIESVRSLHDMPPPGCYFTMSESVFVLAFYDDAGRELSRVVEDEFPLAHGDPRSPEGAAEVRWLIFRPGSERAPTLR